MKALLIALALPIFAGCATGGQSFSGINHPVDIQCTGKGAITGSGSVNAGVGASNNFTIQADCGTGFTFRRSAEQ